MTPIPCAGVRVIGKCLEQHGEVVFRHIGMNHQDRMLGPGALAQHRDCRTDGQQRVVSGRRAVVGDDDRLRGGGERDYLRGLLEKLYRPLYPAACSRELGV